MFASVQFSFPVGFITRDALSHTILLFKSYNGNRSSVHAHVFLKHNFMFTVKKKQLLFVQQNFLARHHHICSYLRISKVLCSSFKFNSIGKRSSSVVVTV